MTLAATTRKLGLDFAAYLRDRLTQAGHVPPLADLITASRSSACSRLLLGHRVAPTLPD